jgi:hypothetical protein
MLSSSIETRRYVFFYMMGVFFYMRIEGALAHIVYGLSPI